MTPTQWANLPDKGRWDIMVALRGPDAPSPEVMKWFTSSVIRGQVREVFNSHGLVNSDLQLVVLPTGYGKSNGWNREHFCSHIHSAAGWLGLPVLSVECKVWIDAMNRRGWKEAGEVKKIAASQFQACPPDDSWMESILYKPEQMTELVRHLKKRTGGV